jgi:peptidylprolyl isomerase
MRKDLLIILIGLLAVLPLGACGGSQDTVETSTNASATSAEPSSGSGKPIPLREPTDMKPNAEGLVGPPPKPKVPPGPPPKTLIVHDLIEGDGETAQAGDQVTVQYAGVEYKTGRLFDSSWEWGHPYSFELGVGNAIEGWEQGIEGMKVGDRRELVIPPDLAYGAGPVGYLPQNTPSEATLVYVVDLLAVE